MDTTTAIAAKLLHEGLTPDNFTLEKAEDIICRCVASRQLIAHLYINEKAIIEAMKNIVIKE